MEGGSRGGEREMGDGSGMGVEGAMYVKVMTDEQLELLRRQIAAYATICEQLVEMHKSFAARQDPLAGMRLGSLYSDPLLSSGGHKMTGRQRWTPTIGQLQILERIFEEDNGAPSKQKIKEITSELSHHGQISETNVYNWFQNRRARSKRKQTAASSNAESEVETEIESLDEKRAKLEKMHSHDNQPQRIEENSSQIREVSCEAQCKAPELSKMQGMYPSSDSSKSSGSLGQMSFYENALSGSSMNQQLDGKDRYSRGHYYFPTSEAMM